MQNVTATKRRRRQQFVKPKSRSSADLIYKLRKLKSCLFDGFYLLRSFTIQNALAFSFIMHSTLTKKEVLIKMSSPSVSVIIPVYNVEKYLEKCVESVLNQDFSDYEIILIDDGSVDNSGVIADKLAENNSKITVIHQKNMGQGGARNTGIQKAAGEYLLFVDSDDCIKENTLSFLYDTAKKNNSDMVLFGMDFVDESGKSVNSLVPCGNGIKNLSGRELMLALINDTYAADKLYRRSLFVDNNIEFLNRVWYEDFGVIMMISLFAEKITLTDKILYYYLQRDNSTMHIKNTDKNEDMLTVVSAVSDFYKKNNAFEKYYNELCFMTVMHMLVLCTLRVSADDSKHPLLKKFHDYAQKNFPDFKKNRYVKENLSKKRKLIFFFSKHKMYGMLKLLNKINEMR